MSTQPDGGTASVRAAATAGTAPATGADVLAHALLAHGVAAVYTLCGNGLDPLLSACRRAGLRVVDTRNEQAAAYMADAVGRLTRTVGVVASSSGVAHLGALAGVTNAWFDGAPLLLITGASGSSHAGRGCFQDMDSVALARPVTKLARWVARPEQVAQAVDEAWGVALSGRPGPVHLTIPADVLSGRVAATPLPARPLLTTTADPAWRAAADGGAIEAAVALIRRAQRPLLVAGSGVFYADAARELARLAAGMQAPVVVPIWDRGAVQTALPQFMGVIGAASGEPRLLPDADLVLLVGAQVDYRLGYLEPPAIGAEARLIRCDVDAAALTQGRAPDVGLHGDPRTVMAQLVAALETGGHGGTPHWLAEARRRDREFRRPWTDAPAAPTPPMTGRHLVGALRQVISDETILLVDGGNIGQWFHMALCDRYPGHWLTCGASGVVGWGLPAAAAVRSVSPDRPVLLLSGDGAATFTIAELETATRQRLPYVCVVADDQAWGIVVSGARQRRQPPVAAELGPIRFDQVAEAFGARGVRIDDPAALPDAIRAGFAADRPTLIHVPIAIGGPAD